MSGIVDTMRKMAEINSLSGTYADEKRFREPIRKKWQMLDEYLSPGNQSQRGSSSMYLLLSFIIEEKEHREIRDLVGFRDGELGMFNSIQWDIKRYIKVTDIFRKRTVEQTKKILEILDTEAIDTKEIVLKRADVIRKEKMRIAKKEEKELKELKALKKERKEGSWLDL